MTKRVAVAVAACGLMAGTARATEVFVVVSTTSNSYAPRVVMIQPGDTVTWTYAGGGAPHNVQADDGSYGNTLSNSAWTFSHVFPTATTSRYYCVAHGGPNGQGMSGAVIVGGGTSWTAAEIAYTLNAWDFESRTPTTASGSSATVPFHRTGSATPEDWIAGVQLPSGAEIKGLEIAGCDNGAGNIVASLSECTDPDGGCIVVANVTAAAIPLCGFSSVPASGVHVNNAGKSYVVEALVGANQTLRSVRVYYSKAVSPAPAVATFNDVPTTDNRFQFVEALVAAGITAGCGGGNYCPDAALTRGQMAVFLSVALGLFWPN